MSHPYALLAELTYRCPLKCPYCSNPLNLRLAQRELDTDDWNRVFIEAAGLGVIQVHLSGGEPLVRRDLDELVASAHAADLYTHVITSGVGADERRLERLRDAGAFASGNDPEAATVAWHWATMVVVAALAAATAIGLLV